MYVRGAIGRSKAEKKETETFCCSKEEWTQAGLTDIDLCKTPSRNGYQVYYHVPNNNFDDILHELSQAQTREDS